MDYVIIPKDTEERWGMDTFSKMDFECSVHLISYMKMMAKKFRDPVRHERLAAIREDWDTDSPS